MRSLARFTAVAIGGAAIGGAAIQSLPLFGGEDPLGDAPAPDNWHHEGLTRHAAQSAGWSREAENALAFHADYLDSYLYSPLWWFDVANGGGPDRIPVVMSSQADLVALHFDDLFHPESVRAAWRRYLSGTAAGLIWLGHVDTRPMSVRTAMAHNLVGASLHAVQDFYSHSNWIDDSDLRSKTWFEVDSGRRACLSLWTGSYEIPSHLGIKPHGAYIFACSVINNLGSMGRQLMSVMCHAASPMAGSTVCQWFRQCAEAEEFTPPKVLGITPPDGILWVEPGINVDTRWGAELGVKTRGLTISAQEAFETAYGLAARTSCQWLHILGHVMHDADLDQFWNAVKTDGVTAAAYKSPTAPWEDFAQIPYRFISTGPYPPPQEGGDDQDWYLRLLIRTSTEPFSGTDADIVPIVDGRRLPVLDHAAQPGTLPGGTDPNRTLLESLVGRNDFEAGDVAAYMVGPLDQAPQTISLLYDAPDAGDVIKAAADALWQAVVSGLNQALDALKSLWGYHADFVDEAHWTIDAATLQSLAPGVRRWFYLDCDGRSEGSYVISGSVEATAETGRFPSGVPWRRYRVHFERLICVKESEWDRFTDSDEPFVLGLVIPHGGGQPITKWRTAPFSGVDTGDIRDLGQTFTVQVPQTYGFISVACAVYESDDETPAERDGLLDQFAGSVGPGIATASTPFVEVLAASIASGWRLGSVEAVAFRRSPTVEVRAYEPRTFDQWVDGGHEVRWPLTERARWLVDVPDTISCDCGACGEDVAPPPATSETARLDFRPKPGERPVKRPKDRDRVTTIELAELDPRCRDAHDSAEPGPEDEPTPAPKPADGCPD